VCDCDLIRTDRRLKPGPGVHAQHCDDTTSWHARLDQSPLPPFPRGLVSSARESEIPPIDESASLCHRGNAVFFKSVQRTTIRRVCVLAMGFEVAFLARCACRCSGVRAFLNRNVDSNLFYDASAYLSTLMCTTRLLDQLHKRTQGCMAASMTQSTCECCLGFKVQGLGPSNQSVNAISYRH